MRAAGVTEFGGPEALHIVDVPEEHAGPGQVRLRVTAAAVNPTDTYLVLGAYADRDPQQVGVDLATCAEVVASTLDAVSGAQWKRQGRRSNGSVFTVASLTRYYVHDLQHHLWDVGA